MVRTASTNVFVSTTAHAHLIQDNAIVQPGSEERDVSIRVNQRHQGKIVK